MNNLAKLAGIGIVVILIAGCIGPATQQRSSIAERSFPITISWEKQFTSPIKPSNLPAITYRNHSKKGISKGVYLIQYTCTGSGEMGSKPGAPVTKSIMGKIDVPLDSDTGVFSIHSAFLTGIDFFIEECSRDHDIVLAVGLFDIDEKSQISNALTLHLVRRD
jgi:hypothetical protein